MRTGTWGGQRLARLHPCPALPAVAPRTCHQGWVPNASEPHRFAPSCHLPGPLRKLRGDTGNARRGQPRRPRHRHQCGARSRQPTEQPGARSVLKSSLHPPTAGPCTCPLLTMRGRDEHSRATRSPGRPWAQPDPHRCGTNGPRAGTDPPRQARALGQSPGAALRTGPRRQGVQEVPISSHRGPTEGTRLGTGTSELGLRVKQGWGGAAPPATPGSASLSLSAPTRGVG